MPLLARIPGQHSIRQFRTAARQRYNEAVRLSLAGDRLAAMYLAGYVVEMHLKAAYFQLLGWSPTQAIQMSDLRGAVKKVPAARKAVCIGNPLHDLESWRDLLIAEREHRGLPYRARFKRRLVSRVAGLALNWRPELRYCTNRPRVAEVRVSLEAAALLRKQFRLL